MYPKVKVRRILFNRTKRQLPKWWPNQVFGRIIEHAGPDGFNMLFWMWLYTWVALGRLLCLSKPDQEQ